MKENSITPICLFTYNRLEATKKTIDALKKNYLSPDSKLIIFSDGPKRIEDIDKVHALRSYLKTIEGFRSVEIIESPTNQGLANSIISGVTQVINQYGRVIVLEDDLVTTPNFLSYMYQALDLYEFSDNIISVCGYGLKIFKPQNYEYDVYLYGRSSSWGWATWKDRWNSIDWEVKDWDLFKNNVGRIKEFNRNGSDMFSMLRSVIEGNGHSWAIRFCYAQFQQNKYSIMPFKSLVENIGFTNEGTNTRFKYSRFKTHMDDGITENFLLSKKLKINNNIIRQCYYYHSLPLRIYSRVRYILGV